MGVCRFRGVSRRDRPGARWPPAQSSSAERSGGVRVRAAWPRLGPPEVSCEVRGRAWPWASPPSSRAGERGGLPGDHDRALCLRPHRRLGDVPPADHAALPAGQVPPRPRGKRLSVAPAPGRSPGPSRAKACAVAPQTEHRTSPGDASQDSGVPRGKGGGRRRRQRRGREGGTDRETDARGPGRQSASCRARPRGRPGR